MKNESKNLQRFYDSCKEADAIYLLDTGSTDNSIEVARSLGSNVIVNSKIYNDFRFDVARNDSISFLPDDDSWIIHLDIDEVLRGNWREEILNVPPKCNHIAYTYVFDEEDELSLTYIASKILKGKLSHEFVLPIHEFPLIKNNKVEWYKATQFSITQKQDRKKNRNIQYCNILERYYEEYKNEGVYNFYLLREYFILNRKEDCINFFPTFIESNALVEQKMLGYLFLASIYRDIKFYGKMTECLINAHKIAPHRRESCLELLKHYIISNDFEHAFWIAINLFNIKDRHYDIVEMAEAWSDIPIQLFKIVCDKLGYKELPLKHLNYKNE